MFDIKKIRNFSIIAHIDHGKSTIADRILELTGAVPKRKMKEQLLDAMELERERGITIKAKSVRVKYHAKDGNEYILNLIDTPGHVDFTYEVSKSLESCEGVLLVVDASQGLEAQTFANMQLAEEHKLVIIPVLNKIDLPNANILEVSKQIEENFLLGLEPICVSGKTGLGIDLVLESIVENIPYPKGKSNGKLAALIIDSNYDSYCGIVVNVRIFDGELKVGNIIKIMASNTEYEVLEVGYLGFGVDKTDILRAGEVGYIIANIKNISSVKIGDTITNVKDPLSNILPGYKEIQPFVYVGLYPINTIDYEALRVALEKLKLNDSSFLYQPETSKALGFGFRCGFLGLLHMDIIKERLNREYNLDLLITFPNVIYKIVNNDNTEYDIDSPSKLPFSTRDYKAIKEPFIRATIITPTEMVGSIMQLCQDKRGISIDMKYLSKTKNILIYNLPLSEILYDFYDKLKSISKGHASFDYQYIGYEVSELVRLEILINEEEIDALTMMCHKDRAYHLGREIIERLRNIIPRQLFEIPIQARVNGKIIVRENIKAIRKDVLAKCYGGDISRKRKLLEKQKEGKKRMKQIGKISIPQEVFSAVLSIKKGGED